MAKVVESIYRSKSEMEIISTDGIIVYAGASLNFKGFKKERDVVKYIEDNIEDYCYTVFEDKYISHKVDFDIGRYNKKAIKGRRVDMVIKCENHTYIVEVKNSKTGIENRQAIGQVLDYGREFTDSKKKMVIISTYFDYNTAKTIDHYNLPITYIYMNKSQSYEFIGQNK